MEIIDISNNNDNSEYVVAIGNFDGIHLGHIEVIKQARRIAKDKHLKLGVVTFDISPKQIVNKIDNYYVLRSFEQKKDILSKLDVDTIFLIHFNNKLMNIEAHDFINKYIIKNNIKYLVCGYDYCYGKDKLGNINTLQAYKEFKTVVIAKHELSNIRVSSTYIHELILNGEIEQANKLLSSNYSIEGIVVHGNQKGTKIGFPTANLKPIVNYRIPCAGVYACKVIYNNKEYYGMTNIGHNPTFNYSNNTSIETNIFNFNKDIYDQKITIIFYKYIRKERIFNDVNELIDQLNKDKIDIMNYFSNFDI